MSFTRTVETSEIEAIPAPFPNTKGTVTIKILNSDQSLGPAVVLLRMEPGSEIARHLHEQTTETSYVLELMGTGMGYDRACGRGFFRDGRIVFRDGAGHRLTYDFDGCSAKTTFDGMTL